MAKAKYPKLSWEGTLERSGLDRVTFAAIVYSHRNLPKEEQNPSGYRHAPYQPIGIKTRSSRWYPHPQEVRICCQQIEEPWSTFTWTYKRHCRTLRHVANLMYIDESTLRDKIGKIPRQHCVSKTCGHFRPHNDYFCKTCRRRLTG